MNELSNIIISILSGIVFGILIYIYFIKKTVLRGPDSNIIKEKIYIDNNKCYILKPKIHKCPYGATHYM
jgi:hypothetical protein